MSPEIQFEEQQYIPVVKKRKPTAKMVDFLINKGIVENAAQATLLLSVVIIACLLGSIMLIYLSSREEPVYTVDPPIEEQMQNNR